jgi:PAS domain S-box-containing protein
MKLSTQLTLAVVGVVFVTATAVGFFTYRDVETAILPGQLERTEMRAQLLADGLENFVAAGRADVVGFRSSAIQGIVRASLDGGVDPREGVTLDQWRAQLARRLVGELTAKPAYEKFRLIGLADGGREIVRVDRRGANGAIRTVEGGELRQKGGEDFFRRAIGLDVSDVYVSPIVLNRENGIVTTPHMPMLRIATPVMSTDGTPFGVLIVDVDMRPAFDAVRRAATGGQHFYVVNDRGDFLVHPDTRREFGFEFGKPDRWQDEFPDFAATLGSAIGGLGVVADDIDERIGIAMSSVQPAGGPRVAVLATMPYSVLIAPADAAKRSSIVVGVFAVLGALALALIAAGPLTGPFAQMAAAIENSSRGRAVRIPTEARGEVGVFARAFARLLGEVKSKTAALEEEVAAHGRTEEVLEQHADRERLFSAAVQSSVDAIMTKTVDGVVTGWNPAAERLFGFSADEVMGKNVDFLVPEERRAEQKAKVERNLRGEKTVYLETVRLNKEGKPIDVSLSVSPIRYPDGTITGACIIARDITEQKLAEEKFKLAVEASPSGILMTDLSGLIVMVNSEVEKLFGYRRDELIGRPVDILLPENLRTLHSKNRRDYFAEPTSRRMGANRDLLGRRKDGTEFSVEVGLNSIQTREGLLILSVIIDVTERKRLDMLKDEFVSTVSHELRTPLTSISGSLGLLIGTTARDLPDQSRRLLSIAQSNSLRLVKLVNDILDIEKLELGRVGFNFAAVELRSLVEQTVEANIGFADTYLVRMRSGLFDEGEVWVDPDRLSQALTNLVSNAIKFSPPDGEVTVSVARLGKTMRLAVRDQGAGIPPEFKPRVFQKFAQADGTNTKKSGGTGLGLSIVKEIITRLGGQVGFEDAPGGGTIFFVDLPEYEAASQKRSAPVIKQTA